MKHCRPRAQSFAKNFHLTLSDCCTELSNKKEKKNKKKPSHKHTHA